MESQIIISDSAANRIAEMLPTEGADKAFRITVEGGGCSGFQYKFDFTPIAADDLVFDKSGAKVVTDSVSIEYLAGSMLDFSKDLSGSLFMIKNPNAKASCGCGSSFAV